MLKECETWSRSTRAMPQRRISKHELSKKCCNCRSNMILGCTRLPSRTPCFSLSLTQTLLENCLQLAVPIQNDTDCTENGIKLWERVRLQWKAASVWRAALQEIWKWTRSICTQASSLTVEGSQFSNDRTRPRDWKLNKSTNTKILTERSVSYETTNLWNAFSVIRGL